MNNEEYKAKLDDNILLLLRIRAMEEDVIATPSYKEIEGGVEALKVYLGKQAEDENYFVRLSDAIGYEPDKDMKRVPVSRQSAWEKVKYVLSRVRGTIADNIHPVTINDKEISSASVMDMLAQLLGFRCGDVLHDAVIIKGFDVPEPDTMISVGEQDFIALALGEKSWASLNGRINAKCKVSVTALKRMFGRVKSTSKASKQKLDYIAEFIAETSWDNLISNINDIERKICNRYAVMSSRHQFLWGRPRKENPDVIYTSRLEPSDKITLTYVGGNYLKLEYVDNYTFKILDVKSSHLKIGYYLTIYEMHVHRSMHSNEIYDENGDMLDMMYDSGIIAEIHFEGIPAPPRKKLDWLDLNGHKLQKPIKKHIFASEKLKNMDKGIMKKKKLCVMGSGSMCFDTIIQREYPQGFVKGKKNKFEDRIVMEEIGSNPGNVMCILGYFGWESYPIAMFDRYPQGLQMKKDFERYHCNTRFVTNTDEGGTNCFSIIHCLDDKTGEPTMKHSKRHAPFSGFPRDKGLTVQGKDATLPKFIEKLDFLPDVYFYSGNNPGWRDLGKYMRSKGVLVYYEIQSMSEKEFSKYFACMKEADIVKFSDETIQDLSFIDELKDKLVIQTLGVKGARFNLCGKGWITLPPIVNDNVVDTEGCGDWTTASFINAIGKRGVLKLADMNEAIVKECLEEAQGYASRNVSYMGTKGIIAADKNFDLAPSDYVDTIMAEMDGHIGIKKEKITSLNAIPEKDIMVYDANDCFIYRSDYECLNGVERVFNKKECSVMSNFYPCKLPYVYNGKELVFNSAEQAYHFFRYREFPLVQWMIMQQRGANDVKSACSGFKYVDSDHEKTRWMYMTLIEELKYLHCKEFRKKINELGDIQLVESSGSDDIFGSAIPGDAKKAIAYSKKTGIDLSGKYIGMNGCGRCIMAVREKFRGWTEQQLKEYTPNPDINIWWETSPAYKELIEGMGKEA